jgi:hypothetical protein
MASGSTLMVFAGVMHGKSTATSSFFDPVERFHYIGNGLKLVLITTGDMTSYRVENRKNRVGFPNPPS